MNSTENNKKGTITYNLPTKQATLSSLYTSTQSKYHPALPELQYTRLSHRLLNQ